ncbi:MAG: hypothetical protein ACKO37_06440 [Vampirovibrionales bacterium]
MRIPFLPHSTPIRTSFVEQPPRPPQPPSPEENPNGDELAKTLQELIKRQESTNNHHSHGHHNSTRLSVLG